MPIAVAKKTKMLMAKVVPCTGVRRLLSVNNAQGQLRVLKTTLESRTNKRVEGDHQAVPWMLMQAATVINKRRRDDEGLGRTGDGKGEISAGQRRSLENA